MKRLFIATTALLLTFIAVNAVNFNPNMYGYNQNEKELTKFFDKCKSLYNPSEKTFKKVQDTYMQLLDKYPEKRELTMMYYGYLNLIANCPLANKEEGFKLMQDALPKLSNSIPEVLVAAINADIACCYLKGIGTPKDEQKSFAFYQKACEIDSAYAENLSYLYYTGVGTKIDEERAFSLLQSCYKKAMDPNRKSFDYSYVIFSREGYEKLFSFLLLERDDVDSLAKEKYREGLRDLYIYRDFDAAKISFESAVERGLPNAMYELGILYDNMIKLNIEKSESKEKRDQWLAKAAEAGYYPAIYMQGFIKFNINATFVAQENKAKADAYQYFKQTADVGYGPGVKMVKAYEINGWPKEANLFGDIAKGVLSVAAMASSIKNDGVVAGLTSQMHNTGEQYGEINTIDDFLGALYRQNEQLKAKRRELEQSESPSDKNVYSDVSSGGNVNADENLSTGMFADLSRQYREWEHRASKDIDTFNKHFGWLAAHKVNNNTGDSNSSDSDYDFHNHMYSSAKKALKTDLEALRNTRAAAAKDGFNIPMGMIEDTVEVSLKRPDPRE